MLKKFGIWIATVLGMITVGTFLIMLTYSISSENFEKNIIESSVSKQ